MPARKDSDQMYITLTGMICDITEERLKKARKESVEEAFNKAMSWIFSSPTNFVVALNLLKSIPQIRPKRLSDFTPHEKAIRAGTGALNAFSNVIVSERHSNILGIEKLEPIANNTSGISEEISYAKRRKIEDGEVIPQLLKRISLRMAKNNVSDRFLKGVISVINEETYAKTEIVDFLLRIDIQMRNGGPGFMERLLHLAIPERGNHEFVSGMSIVLLLALTENPFSKVNSQPQWLAIFLRKCAEDDKALSALHLALDFLEDYRYYTLLPIRKSEYEILKKQEGENLRTVLETSGKYSTLRWVIPDKHFDLAWSVYQKLGDKIGNAIKFQEKVTSRKEVLTTAMKKLWQDICENQTQPIAENGQDRVRVTCPIIESFGFHSITFVCEGYQFPAVGLRFHFVIEKYFECEGVGHIDENGNIFVKEAVDEGIIHAVWFIIMYSYHRIVVGARAGNGDPTDSKSIMKEKDGDKFPVFVKRKPMIRTLPKGHAPHWKEDPERSLLVRKGRVRKPEANETVVRDFFYTAELSQKVSPLSSNEYPYTCSGKALFELLEN